MFHTTPYGGPTRYNETPFQRRESEPSSLRRVAVFGQSLEKLRPSSVAAFQVRNALRTDVLDPDTLRQSIVVPGGANNAYRGGLGGPDAGLLVFVVLGTVFLVLETRWLATTSSITKPPPGPQKPVPGPLGPARYLFWPLEGNRAEFGEIYSHFRY